MDSVTRRIVRSRRCIGGGPRGPRPKPGAFRLPVAGRLLVRRVTGGCLRAGIGLLLALAPPGVAAQERDTVRTDTVRVPAVAPPDTLPGLRGEPADSFLVVDSIAVPDDSVSRDTPPAQPVPTWQTYLPDALPAGFAEGVWLWARDDLLRSTAMSVADLLAQVPGLVGVRSGYFGAPEGVAGHGAAGADVRVYLDGYALDPIGSAALDLSRIDLVNLEQVRVVRRGGRLRVELVTLAWAEQNAHTVVEGATGDLGLEVLRGAFRAPRFLFGPFSASLSRLSSDGLQGAEPAELTGGWVKWGYLSERWGVHLEYRSAGVERAPGAPVTGDGGRDDLILRARVRPANWLVTELFAGRSRGDELFQDTVRAEAVQWGGRFAVDLPSLGADGAVRLRHGDDIGPGLALESTVRLDPLQRLGLRAGAHLERWQTGQSFAGFDAGLVAGPILGARLFADWARGERGVPYLYGPDGDVRSTGRHTLRAGADWGRAGWRLGGAVLRLEGDAVAPPALPGLQDPPSRSAGLYPGFRLDGVEVSGHVPLYLLDGLGLEGSYTLLRDRAGRAFDREHDGWSILQPLERARGGIVYHGLPLGHDQLEVFARLETEYRGAMLVIGPGTAAGMVPGEPVGVEPVQRYNLDLQIRILSVRAFVHWGNLLHELDQLDVPGRPLPGRHAYFGVKWQLHN